MCLPAEPGALLLAGNAELCDSSFISFCFGKVGINAREEVKIADLREPPGAVPKTPQRYLSNQGATLKPFTYRAYYQWFTMI
jgi:hypothetical protein